MLLPRRLLTGALRALRYHKISRCRRCQSHTHSSIFLWQLKRRLDLLLSSLSLGLSEFDATIKKLIPSYLSVLVCVCVVTQERTFIGFLLSIDFRFDCFSLSVVNGGEEG